MLKIYNSANFYYVQFHLESRIKDKTLDEIIIQKYFTFYTKTLRDAEGSSSFYNLLERQTTPNRPRPAKGEPFICDLMKNGFIIAAGLALYYGAVYEDHQLFNMGLVCLFEIQCEMYVTFFPCWYHR